MSALLRHTDKKREAILQAAIAEFCCCGYESTSMDKIAASAEVSKRTVYNHFPSKEALFDAILEQLWETAVVANSICYQPELSLAAQLRAFLQRNMELFCDPNFIKLARVVVAATIHAPERARDMVERVVKNEMGIVGWIRAAQADGKLKGGAEAGWMGDLLVGMMKSLAFWPQVIMGQEMLTEASRQAAVETVLRMFLAVFAVEPSDSDGRRPASRV